MYSTTTFCVFMLPLASVISTRPECYLLFERHLTVTPSPLEKTRSSFMLGLPVFSFQLIQSFKTCVPTEGIKIYLKHESPPLLGAG